MDVKGFLKQYPLVNRLNECRRRFRCQIYPISFGMEHILAAMGSRPARRGSDGGEGVLIVKPDAIGDFVIFSRYIDALLHLFPGAPVDFLISGRNRELAADCTAIRRIIDAPGGGKRQEIRLIRRLRRSGYHTVLYPVFSREARYDRICLLAGAEETITMDGGLDRQPARIKTFHDRRYGRLVPVHRDAHEAERMPEFLKNLGYSDGGFRTIIRLREEHFRRLRQTAGLNENERYVVMVPGCGVPIRYWGDAPYAEVVACLADRKEVTVVLLGSPSEKEMAERILAMAGVRHPRRVVNLTGETDLHEMAAIVSRAAVYVGSETSAVHMAELYGVPSVCIIGGGHYGRFYPYPGSRLDYPVTSRRNCFYCNWNCIGGRARCITDVTAGQVIERLNQILPDVSSADTPDTIR